MLFNALAAILCFAFAAILIYDYAKMSDGHFGHHRYGPSKSIGNKGWANMVLVVVVKF
jgi:hypothetical protein